MTDQTPEQIRAQMATLQVDLAKAIQPLLADAVTALQDAALQTALTKLQALADQIGKSSTTSVQINNVIGAFNSCANAVNREAQGVAATISAAATVTAPADPSTPAS